MFTIFVLDDLNAVKKFSKLNMVPLLGEKARAKFSYYATKRTYSKFLFLFKLNYIEAA